MIKFFRRIRQNLLSEGKTGKYLKYALGEIILVVIGILIALGINNWNEQSKIKSEQTQLLNSIKADLKADIKMLNDFLAKTKERQQILFAESEKISDPSFASDSIISFVQNEVFIYFEDFNGFNNNTYNSAKSSGKIEIIADTIKRVLYDLSVEQERASNTEAKYYDVLLKSAINLNEQYPLNLPFSYVKNGPVNDLMWSNANKKDLALRLNSWGTSKANLYRLRIFIFEDLLGKTQSILDLMEK